MFDDFEKPIYPEFYGQPDYPERESGLPKKLHEISIQLRSWRGHSALRVAAPILSGEIGTEISISAFANIERGNVERVPVALIDMIQNYLDKQAHRSG